MIDLTFILSRLFSGMPTSPDNQSSSIPNVSLFLFISFHFLFKDREAFAALVREVASPDVGRMGIEILSFTIKDIEDNVSYLDSLGKTQTAKVKRDADIGVAESNRDAGIRVGTCTIKITKIGETAVRNLNWTWFDF